MTPPAATPETDPSPQAPAPDRDLLAGIVEAVLLCSDRPVAALRLAEAAGLITLDDDASTDADFSATPPESSPTPPPATDAPPPTDDAAAPTTPVVEVKKKRRRKADSPDADARKHAVESVRAAVEHLNSSYEQTSRSFRIEAVAGGYRIMTLPAFAHAVARFHGARSRTSLSHAALETLAIISYKQPITRARLEAIRGVACGEILRSLIDRRLVTIAGRAEELGRPILYGTTKRFLELFGLASLKDLPSAEDLRPKT